MNKLFLLLILLLSPFAAKAQQNYYIKDCVVVSTASTNANNCGGAAVTRFYGIQISNTTATVYYLRLYNLGTAPTCSSATGFIRSIPLVPTGQTGQTIIMLPAAVIYNTGLSYCITGGSSSTDNTNAAAGIFGTILYTLR